MWDFSGIMIGQIGRFLMKKWIGFGLVTALAVAALGDDWPVWRGPNDNGISNETGWSLKGAKKTWTKELGVGYSSVTVKGDRLYTMGHKDGNDVVYCLDASTGEEIWTQSYPCAPGKYKGPRATPVIDGDFVYAVSRDAEVRCFDAASGKEVWKTDVLGETGNANIKWGISTSPVIEGDLLLLNIGESGVALKKKDGAIDWKSRGASSYASPVVFDYKNKRTAAIFAGDGLRLVVAATGKELGFLPWEPKYKVNGADPLILDNDRMFIASGYGYGCALLDYSSGKIEKVWENDRIKPHFGTPVAMDGYIYGEDGQTKGKGFLRCISVEDGSEQWNSPIGFGSLMAADGRLIVLTEGGELQEIEASPKALKQIATFNTGLGKLCWTAPVLANGIIYCRNDKGTLVAIDVSK
jgi:outer membrane protein assembly factor BamB